MPEWKMVRLAEIAVPKGLVGGPFGSSLGSKDYRSSGVPVIRGVNLSSRGKFIDSKFVYVSEEKADRELARNLAEPGDVVFTQRGTLGQVGIVPVGTFKRYVISQSQMRLRVDAAIAKPEFVYYYFRSPEAVADIHNHAITTGVPHINLGILSDLSLQLPLLSYQEMVCDLLGAIDDKIHVNDRILDAAYELGSASFCSFFAEALQAVVTGAALPMGWNLSSLGEGVSVLETGTRPRGGVAGYTSGIPSIGAESIVRLAKFDFAKVKYVPLEFFASMRRGILQDHDILLYKDGGRPGKFEPHVSMFGNGYPFEQACINEHVYRIRMAPPLSQAFGHFWLASDPLMSEMRSRGTGVAIPGLNSRAVKDLPLVQPPQNLLASFGAIAEPLIDQALAAAAESHKLHRLRDALLPGLMSGAIRVRDAEKAVEEAL